MALIECGGFFVGENKHVSDEIRICATRQYAHAISLSQQDPERLGSYKEARVSGPQGCW